MNVLTDIQELAALPGPLHLAIGVFDGVHRGHQAVIRLALESREREGGEVVVVTFDPHPAAVLAPLSAPRLLTSTHHKALLLGEILGVGNILAVRFDREFSDRTGDEFIRRLCEVAEVGSISVGVDFQFGRNRSGNVELLENLSQAWHFRLNTADIVEVDGIVASSTKIREAVEAGDFETARKLLGRNYTVLGTVVEGRRMGRTIGFPTANLTVHSEQLPPSGVYAVRAKYRGETRDGVANLGFRPTVEAGDAKRLLEVYLFDLDREIYGEDLEVDFVHFLRGEKKFDGIETLKSQIANDVKAARGILEGV